MSEPTLPLSDNPHNALAREKSPYLLQHAHNPVDWLPWGDEAFDRARAENKPIFLSVGYSTCHWCHVMERESFENLATAQLMNQHFVSVKVDREERPDVDRLYMTFVQAATGQGGWPMSVFLTPEGKPFYGGTYYPPQDAYGRPGFPTLLHRLAEAWEADRGAIETSAGNALNMLQRYAEVSEEPEGAIDWKALCDTAYTTLASEFDSELGGFGDAPKFPRPVNHDFLHRYAFARSGANSVPALKMSAFTLRAMQNGGMNDQLGGGFHRYSVDAHWVVPHFEKMLYDQAQLVGAYVEMYQLSGEARFAEAARATLDYVARDMTHSEGGFFAAEDADSLPPSDAAHPNGAHKEEGAFFVWTQDEFDAFCGDDAPLLRRYYNVRANGNAPRQGDPHGEFQGKNILFLSESLAEVSKHFSLTPDDAAQRIARVSAKLFAVREQRPRPHRDEKVIVAWNGLMIGAFARAAQALDELRYTQASQRAAAFIERELWDDEAKTLRRHYKDGAADVAAFADDYAFLADGLLDLYEADFDPAHLTWAETLLDSLDRDFYDPSAGGYFNAQIDPRVPVRFKEDYDGAEPSANSLAARVGLRLAEITDNRARRDRAEATLRAFAARLQFAAHAMPLMLGAALRAQTPPLHIVIVGPQQREDTRALLQEVHRHFLPFRTLLLVEDDDALASRLPFTQGMTMRDGQATAYVCRDFACQQPVTTPTDLHAQLEAFNQAAHG